MKKHAFKNSNPAAFDSDCLVCGGKDRDAVHSFPIAWKTCTEERYYEMLGVLPPAAQDRHGAFLVGEPYSTRDGAYTFRAFKCECRHYSESETPVTFRQFQDEHPSAVYLYHS